MRPGHNGERTGPHPVHAILLSFPIALFSAAVVTDIAYLRSAEIQWSDFSAWLISGALVGGGLVLAWAVIGFFVQMRSSDGRGSPLYLGVIVAMLAVGLVNAFKHSQDGWTSVGAVGLGLSVVSAVLAVVAGVIANSGQTAREISR